MNHKILQQLGFLCGGPTTSLLVDWNFLLSSSSNCALFLLEEDFALPLFFV